MAGSAPEAVEGQPVDGTHYVTGAKVARGP
ncbi:hypothetical protein KIPB_017020, partial [Kipferlia bialata]|eukprot:g17020.t1